MIRGKSLLIIALTLIACANVGWAVAFNGTTGIATGEIVGTESWGTNNSRMSWKVNNTTVPGYWTYIYTFAPVISGNPHTNEIDFLLIETGANVTTADILNFRNFNRSDSTFVEVGIQPAVGTQPEAFRAMRIVYEEANQATVALPEGQIIRVMFETEFAPAWGDFYAQSAGIPTNTIRNVGFTANDVDPANQPGNCPIDNHILVPGTPGQGILPPTPPDNGGVTPPGVIPEPLTMLAFSAGVGFIARKIRKNFRK